MYYNQRKILNKLKTYTEKYNINLGKNINFNKGFCSGFSVIWLYAMWLNFQEKGDKERDNIDWFYASLKKIGKWDAESTLTEKEQNTFNYFLQHLIFFQNIKDYLKINQWNLDQCVEDTKGRKPSKEFSFAGLFTYENLENLLKKILIHENRLIYIGSHNHATAIFKHKNTYYFYDPNNNQGHIEALSKAVFKANNFDIDKQSPICINIFTFDEPKKKNYPDLSSLVKYITLNRYDSNYCDGKTSLYMACQNDNLEIVKYLIGQGADVDQADDEDTTPLFTPCECGHLEIVKYLIGHKANVNKANNSDLTPLYMACQEGHLEIVKYLIGHKANVNKANNSDLTPLYIACQEGHLEIVKYLIEHKADVNKTRNDGISPLLIACQNGHLEIVKYLIKQEAKINKARYNGTTPLYKACQKGHLEIVKYLIEHRANVNKARNGGATPLYIAFLQNYHKIAKELMLNGGDCYFYKHLPDIKNYPLPDIEKHLLIQFYKNFNEAIIRIKKPPFGFFRTKPEKFFEQAKNLDEKFFKKYIIFYLKNKFHWLSSYQQLIFCSAIAPCIQNSVTIAKIVSSIGENEHIRPNQFQLFCIKLASRYKQNSEILYKILVTVINNYKEKLKEISPFVADLHTKISAVCNDDNPYLSAATKIKNELLTQGAVPGMPEGAEPSILIV